MNSPAEFDDPVPVDASSAVVMYHNVVWYYANRAVRRLQLPPSDAEDFSQTGFLAVVKAMRSFCRRPDVKPVTFFTACIKREIAKAVRDQFVSKGRAELLSTASLDARAGDDDRTAGEMVASPVAGCEITPPTVAEMTSGLEPQLRGVIFDYYLAGIPLLQIGHAAGLSHKTALRRHQAALDVLRATVDADGRQVGEVRRQPVTPRATRERNAARRLKRKAEGQCVRCAAVRDGDHSEFCESCRQKQRDYQILRRTMSGKMTCS